MSPCFLSQLMAPTQPATGSLLLPLLPPAAAQWAANGEAQGETGGGSSHSETPPNPGWGGVTSQIHLQKSFSLCRAARAEGMHWPQPQLCLLVQPPAVRLSSGAPGSRHSILMGTRTCSNAPQPIRPPADQGSLPACPALPHVRAARGPGSHW